ncbi:glycoside hydrolase family 5 protein [Tessaracoccus sp. OS52]|uniref:glycoside hydrolase family 5 protein n=1 Tax=Tessaracoccus sp. OS52 TaxID=2886691 RepID=UPI001D11E12F|nr:cellulase family glycosylhydrolase [Tessaracoccus sp. OS52]MCC2594362.1 glycoside hydrolase family 5 protein [Tessaracoccus sp. OS52]
MEEAITRRSLLMGTGAVVATSVATSLLANGVFPSEAAAEPTTWTDVVGHFESRHEPWAVHLGNEYGAAVAEFTLDESRAAQGLKSGRLRGDFSASGRYVALRKTLGRLAVTRVTFKVRTEHVSRVQVRLVSATQGQRNAQVNVTPGASGWQDVSLTHWNNIAGMADVIRLELQVWKDHLTLGATSATAWFDDVRVEHTVDPQVPASLETTGLPLVLTGEPDLVPLVVRARYADGSALDVTQHSTLTSGDESVLRVNEFGYLTPVAPGATEISIDHLGVTHVFPIEVRTPQQLAGLRVVDGKLMDGERRFGFTGFNYDLVMLRFPRNADWTALDADVALMAHWGLRAVRVPINLGMVQPARGVFPDDDAWLGEITSRGMNPQWLAMLDHFVEQAGKHGIRLILDWHRFPVDPYDYWSGGNNHDAGTGKPGTAFAYLAPSSTERGALDLSNPEHLAALLDSHKWLAGHYRGNGAVMGIEIPHNEPHDAFMSIQANWRRVTEKAALAVKGADPDRLVFAMVPAYGHDVSTAVATWQLPNLVDGNAPHHYLPNAPIDLRPDAQERRSPWLARDVDDVFSHAISSLFAPYSTSPVPVYNGEGGSYGWESFLPGMPQAEAGELMIEAGLAQYYAAGAVGQLHWALWHNASDFVPFREVFDEHFRRFSPVYAAGPVDWSGAQVALIQNPAAVPIANGHNFSVVPFVRLALDLHLPRFHLLTDDEVIDRLLTMVPTGLEQVDGLSAEFSYKAVVADRRNLDARVRSVLESESFDIPILWTDDLEELDADALADFLEGAGVLVDKRTSVDYQFAVGPEHLVVYRRGEKNPGRDKIHPRIEREGSFRLIAEDGSEVFSGTTDSLVHNGIRLPLEKWHSAIFRIA